MTSDPPTDPLSSHVHGTQLVLRHFIANNADRQVVITSDCMVLCEHLSVQLQMTCRGENAEMVKRGTGIDNR